MFLNNMLSLSQTLGFILGVPSYYANRWIVWGILVILVILILVFTKKGKKARNALLLVSGSVWLIFAILASCLPLENLFATYSSTQSALNYTTEGKVAVSIDGADSTLVIHTYNDVDSHQFLWYWYKILPRTDKGWKMANPKSRLERIGDDRNVGTFGEKHYSITVVSHESHQGYYVIVMDCYRMGGNPVVTDTLGSDFQVFVEPDGIDAGYVWWVTYIAAFDENYNVYINETPYTFQNRYDKGTSVLSQGLDN